MLTLRNVTFLSADPGRLADFWAAALGLPERRDTETEVLLADVEWAFPRYTFQRVEPGRPVPAGSVHLDLTALDRAAEVRRLVALGATEVRTVEGVMTWTVLFDPDGNELCVSQG